MDRTRFFAALWRNFAAIAPQAVVPALGSRLLGEYDFEAKRLRARADSCQRAPRSGPCVESFLFRRHERGKEPAALEVGMV
jgi:hypothetical protein